MLLIFFYPSLPFPFSPFSWLFRFLSFSSLILILLWSVTFHFILFFFVLFCFSSSCFFIFFLVIRFYVYLAVFIYSISFFSFFSKSLLSCISRFAGEGSIFSFLFPFSSLSFFFQSYLSPYICFHFHLSPFYHPSSSPILVCFHVHLSPLYLPSSSPILVLILAFIDIQTPISHSLSSDPH